MKIVVHVAMAQIPCKQQAMKEKARGPPGDGVEKGSTICKNRLGRTASWPGVWSVLLYVIPVRKAGQR